MTALDLDIFLQAGIFGDDTHIYRIDHTMLIVSNPTDQERVLSYYPPQKIKAHKKTLTTDTIPKSLVVVLTDGATDTKAGYIQMNATLWQQTLGLPSALDVLAYLAALYADETLSPQDFLQSPIYYHRAWQVEKHLQSLEYMPRVSPLIKSAVYKDTHSLALLAKHQQYARLWQRLIMKTSLDDDARRMLLWQSGYTTMKIVGHILDYHNIDQADKQIGMVHHEHDYHCFGTHFVVVIYGTDPQSELYKDTLIGNHQAVLKHFLDELSPKEVHSVYLLGIDLSQSTQDGETDVQMDVWHSSVGAI